MICLLCVCLCVHLLVDSYLWIHVCACECVCVVFKTSWCQGLADRLIKLTTGNKCFLSACHLSHLARKCHKEEKHTHARTATLGAADAHSGRSAEATELLCEEGNKKTKKTPKKRNETQTYSRRENNAENCANEGK